MPDNEDPTHGWDKDLENIIRAVVSTENEALQKQKELERMHELVETQKKKIEELEKALQDQVGKMVMTAAILPPDVELKHMGEMRNEINQKDALLEARFVEINRLKSDLNFLRTQLNDTSQDVQRGSSEASTLRATLAEKNKHLEAITQELQANTEALAEMNKQYEATAQELQAKTGALAEKNKQLEAKTQELAAKTEALGQLEKNSYDVLKLREELEGAQNNLLAREKLILEKDAKIAELEAKVGQSQASPDNKEEIEKIRGELAAKDFDLKMQEGTITELREQIEEAKRRADMPDPNAGRIDSLSKQLHQTHNENAKLSLQVKVQEDQIQAQKAKIVALQSAGPNSEITPATAKSTSGAHLTKKLILHTTTKEERHFEI